MPRLCRNDEKLYSWNKYEAYFVFRLGITVCVFARTLALAGRSSGWKYNGTVNTTISGRTCQRWSSQSPHLHRYHNLVDQENYCRDANNNGAPWCYTTDHNQTTEFCLIYAEEGE